jgi:oligopeptide/dipeptide ABC transporter ATP-binding protein
MTAKNDVLLRVENLTTRFNLRRGIVTAVDGVSFFVREGESFGLVGESGCGKTMTGLSILGLAPKPAAEIVGGEIIFEGRNLLELSEAEMRTIRGSKLSMILQDPLTSLNPMFTIGNQIGEVLRIHLHAKGADLLKKVIGALKLVQVPAAESRASNYPHQMSGGMRQRVCGAIALSCHPSLIIADEPTTALDLTIQAQYLKFLKEIQQQYGTAIIFITHDLGIIAKMCERVAVMYAGRIVEAGYTREIFSSPRHCYTQALLSCVPKFEAEQDSLSTIEGQPPDLANPPPGCRFAPRCCDKGDKCETSYPPTVMVDENHSVSCWLCS